MDIVKNGGSFFYMKDIIQTLVNYLIAWLVRMPCNSWTDYTSAKRIVHGDDV